MGPDALLTLGKEALLLMLLGSLPAIMASLIAGFLSSLFQATTQIQDSTLSVVPKLAAAAVSLLLAGPWMARQLSRFAAQLLISIPWVQS
ncbi:MAG: flagellar biosynthetic protein FliQ [Myxococcaceae bacterium]